MSAVFLIAVALHLVFFFYRRAKRGGAWSWRKFYLVIGAIFLLPLVLALPSVALKGADAHPGMILSIVYGGVLVIVVVFAYFNRKSSANAPGKDVALSSAIPASKGNTALGVGPTAVSSAPNDQAKSVKGTIMQMTQTIRFDR